MCFFLDNYLFSISVIFILAMQLKAERSPVTQRMCVWYMLHFSNTREGRLCCIQWTNGRVCFNYIAVCWSINVTLIRTSTLVRRECWWRGWPARYNDTRQELLWIVAFQCGERASSWARAVQSIVVGKKYCDIETTLISRCLIQCDILCQH